MAPNGTHDLYQHPNEWCRLVGEGGHLRPRPWADMSDIEVGTAEATHLQHLTLEERRFVRTRRFVKAQQKQVL